MPTEAELLFAEIAQQADKEWDTIKDAKPQNRGNLPAGLRGVAQLRTIQLRKDDKENHRCSVEFVVRKHDPLDEGGDFVNAIDYCGCKLVGDQYKTLTERLQQHTVLLINLGAENVSDTEGFEDFATIYADINRRQPLFKFHTFVMDGSDYVNIQCDGPYTGDDIESTPSQTDLDTLGHAADTGDSDAMGFLTNLAAEHSLNPDEYPTWAELATALTSVQAQQEFTGNPVPSHSWADVGTLADGGDGTSQEELTQAALQAGINPDEYQTWADLAAQIEGNVAAQATEPATEPAEESYIPLSTKGRMVEECDKADAGDAAAEKHLIECAESVSFDHNEYATWADAGPDLFAAMYPNTAAAQAGTSDAPAATAAAGQRSFHTAGIEADNGDPDAQDYLTAAAVEHSINPDDYATWREVAELIYNNEVASKAAPMVNEPIVVGQMYGYVVEGVTHSVEVIAVDQATITAEVLSYTDSFIYEGVPLDELVDDPNAS